MTGQVLVLRGEPGASATANRAARLGLTATIAPMSEARSVPWQAPERGSYDALLLGSANAVRLGGAALAACRGAPALVVGETTARAAQAAGLKVAAVGEGGLQAVLDQIGPDHPYRRLLRLAGEDHVALAAPPGVSIETRIVYTVAYLPLLDPALTALRHGALILLHSAAAARHFAMECNRLELDRDAVRLAALAPRVAAAAGTGWRAIGIAPRPDDRALLELARDMCQ